MPSPVLLLAALLLTPLAALDLALLVPGDGVVAAARVRALLEGLPPQALEPPPQRLPGRKPPRRACRAGSPTG